MPEGPEIWRASDTINEAVAGKKVEDIFFMFEELKEYEEIFKGSMIKSVSPRGKAIVTSFDNGLTIYSHNQLYGKWMIENRGDIPDTKRSLRLAIHTGDKSAFLYSASEIQVLKSDEIERHRYINKLGPDVVNPETTYEEVRKRFTSDNFRNRRLTTLLLDPGFLSGIGNYLRSEILFCAGVNPGLKPRDCSEEELERLAECALNLSRRSYETNGLTTSDDLVKALQEEGATRKQYRHYAYGRAGKPCYECGEEIQVMTTGGRKVYFCNNEQK